MSGKKAKLPTWKLLSEDGPIGDKSRFEALFLEGWVTCPKVEDEDLLSGGQDNDTLSKNGKHNFMVTCPHPGCRQIVFGETNTRYGNAIRHATTHYTEVAIDSMVIDMRRDYALTKDDELVKKKRQTYINECHLATSQDKGIYQALILAILHNTPFGKFKDKSYTDHLKEETPSLDVILATMLELTLIVEEKIAAEMKGKKIVITHDGWSRFGRHYVALFVIYCHTSQGGRKDAVEQKIRLLAVSTLPAETEGDDESATASSFNSATHCKFICQSFKNVDIDNVAKVVACQVTDSTALMPKIAKDLGIPHIGCRGHGLSNGAKKMGDDDEKFTQLCEVVNNCHKNIRQSNNLSADLENAQDKSARVKCDSKTRWLAREAMLKSHIGALESIKTISVGKHSRRLSDDSKKSIEDGFIDELKATLEWFSEVATANRLIQGKGMLLSDVQLYLDELMELVDDGHGIPGNDFEKVELGMYRTCFTNPCKYDSNPYFTGAIIKIQRKEEHLLTQDEKDTVKHLIKPATAENPSPPSPTRRKRKKSKLMGRVSESKKTTASIQLHHSDYDDVAHHCVIGTACEPEGLWSQGDAILTKRRSSMSPLNFECILYLKYNRGLWSLSDVIEANRRRKNSSEANQEKLKARRERILSMKERVKDWDEFQDLLDKVESNIDCLQLSDSGSDSD